MKTFLAVIKIAIKAENESEAADGIHSILEELEADNKIVTWRYEYEPYDITETVTINPYDEGQEGVFWEIKLNGTTVENGFDSSADAEDFALTKGYNIA